MTSSEKFARYLIGPISVALAVVIFVYLDVRFVGPVLAGAFAAIGFAALFTYQSTEANDLADALFLSALTDLRPVNIALTDHRVIVGYVMEATPNLESRWLKVLPLALGYTSEGPGGFTLKTFYLSALTEFAGQEGGPSEGQIEKLSLLIDKSAFLTVQPFDFGVYSLLVDENDDAKSTPVSVVDLEKVRNLLLSQRESKDLAAG